MRTRTIVIEVPLEYRVGRDEPERGIFRNSVSVPDLKGELTVSVAQLPVELAGEPDLDPTPQMNFAGSAEGLEALGLYLIALARLESADPAPYGTFEGLTDDQNNSVRLIVRRTGSKT